MNYIIKKALISEKSFGSAANDKFTFIVDKKAGKDEIAENCESLFGVTVIDVNTANYKGKIKMSKKGRGARSDFKKAVVTVKKGQKIDLFEVETEKDKKKNQKAKDQNEKEKAKKEEVIDKNTTVKVREKKK